MHIFTLNVLTTWGSLSVNYSIQWAFLCGYKNLFPSFKDSASFSPFLSPSMRFLHWPELFPPHLTIPAFLTSSPSFSSSCRLSLCLITPFKAQHSLSPDRKWKSVPWVLVFTLRAVCASVSFPNCYWGDGYCVWGILHACTFDLWA